MGYLRKYQARLLMCLGLAFDAEDPKGFWNLDQILWCQFWNLGSSQEKVDFEQWCLKRSEEWAEDKAEKPWRQTDD